MNIENLTCETWADFRNLIISSLYEGSRFVRGRYWFRGQGSSNMRLESSFDRWYARAKCASSDRFRVANELVKNFVKEATCLSEYELVKQSEPRTMALARHYGLPTRQLDWSESPYVAAFFAFSDCDLRSHNDDDVAVWALDTLSEHWGKERGVELETIEASGNLRLKSQSGHFTILRTPAACLEDYLSAFPGVAPGGAKPLYKFIIPAEFARQALSDLDSMDINHAQLYPGLEGCALTAKIRQQLQM